MVVRPDRAAERSGDRLLYNQTTKRFRAAIVGRELTVIADVPYRRDR